jgi:hypothetical protein
MTNAKCLTEGVNVPAIDCVLFADPKQSVVDIVQAAGRALRVNEGKKFGYIMMPLIVPDDMDLEEFTESTPFKQVARIVTALSTQDERIVEEFRLKNEGKRIPNRRIEISGTLPIGLNFDISSFASSIEAKYWERVGRSNYRPFIEARSYAHSLGLKNMNEWLEAYDEGKIDLDIPKFADQTYKSQKKWISWGDWLGTGNVAVFLRQYRPYNEAKEFVSKLKLKSTSEWLEYCQSGLKPKDIPSNPNRTYFNLGWENYSEWLGSGKLNTKDFIFLPFEDARTLVRGFNLANQKEWNSFVKSAKKPKNIPSNPQRTYNKLGWNGWGDWLGNSNESNHQKLFKPFNEALIFVHSLKLSNTKEWKRLLKSGNKPKDIPTNPNEVYKNDGWRNWPHWLGTNNRSISNDKYWGFQEAKEFVHNLKLKNTNEWRAYTNNPEFPFELPKNPRGVYKSKGWKSMGDWLGTGTVANFQRQYRSYGVTKALAKKMKIKTYSQWAKFAKSGQRPIDIPSHPDITYKTSGWEGWADFLGKE